MFTLVVWPLGAFTLITNDLDRHRALLLTLTHVIFERCTCTVGFSSFE